MVRVVEDAGPEVDIVDPSVYEQGGVPFARFDWLRRHAPVSWHDDDVHPDWPGFWAITRHDDVHFVSRHAELFSSHVRLSLFEEFDDDTVAMQQQMMLFLDPPAHTRLRNLVNRGFTPRAIKQLEDHVRTICNELIDDVVERGSADFVHDIAAPLPAYVICELIGASPDDRKRIVALSNRLIGFDDPELATSMEDGAEAAAEVYQLAQFLAEKRRAEPAGDIASQLVAAESSGNGLTDDEFNLFILMLVIAGNETTRNASAGGMLALFEHPDQWDRLGRDRSLMATMPDELVRWVSPLNLFRRTATDDVELRGQHIRKGDKVVLFYPSANRDEDVFPDPSTFDVGRDPNPHVGFGGGGPHFCLGSHLARLELRILFECILDRMPDIRLAGEPRRLRSNFINGIKRLPVEFTATPRLGG